MIYMKGVDDIVILGSQALKPCEKDEFLKLSTIPKSNDEYSS
jgi:hypothetical protein